MRTSKIAAFGVCVFTLVSGCATYYPASEVDGLLDHAKLQDLKNAKEKCEEITGLECVITGGYIPKMKVQVEEKDSRNDPI